MKIRFHMLDVAFGMGRLLTCAALVLALQASAASTEYWLGTAPAVKQAGTITVTAYDAATTYNVVIGGVTVGVVGSGGTTTTVATALKNALIASTEPYFTAVTWTSSSAVITGTAGTAGVPFTATTNVSGGTGTIGAYSATTASSGPNDWSTAANWSGGAVPVSTDTVIFANNAVSVAYGLAQSGVTLTALRTDQSYTGNIGLNYLAFATSADGATVNSARVEYRPVYLAISVTTHTHGLPNGIGTLSGMQRFLINYGSNAATVNVINTATTSAEKSRSAPAMRILCNHASTVVNVRSAPGGVGIAAEQPAETATLATVSIADTTTASKVITGRGVTLTTWTQAGGINFFAADNNCTTLNVNGGTLTSEGSMAIATINVNGGTYNSNHTGSGTTLNLFGGTINGFGSPTARAWGTIVFKTGGDSVIQFDASVVTYTAITLNGRLSLTAAGQ